VGHAKPQNQASKQVNKKESPVAAARDRFRAAIEARSECATPDRSTERRVWQASLDALRAYDRDDSSEPFPPEIAAEIANAIEEILQGQLPERLKVLQGRRRTVPGGQKARYVEDAVRYILACRERIIPDMNVEQGIKEVAFEYEISASTAAGWYDAARSSQIEVRALADEVPHDLPADLASAEPAKRLDALMRRSGYYYRIWPRLP
jgi:hypothetical protein